MAMSAINSIFSRFNLSNVPQYLAAAIGVMLLGALFVRNFWAMSDLWLLARVSRQVWAGHGPVWNHIDGDRVWVYTSVAWQWLLVATHGITGGAEPFLQAIILHSVVLVAMVALLLWRWMDGRKFLVAILLMIGSNVVIDYSSGGLENGLVHLLVVAMWAMLMRGVKLRWLSLVFGLGMLVRHDMVVLLGPVMAYAFWEYFRSADWGTTKKELLISAVLCVAPILAWTAFAWMWYGSPIPESFDTKSEQFGISVSLILYWIALLIIDPWAVVITLVGIVFAFAKGNTRARFLGAGLVLYLAYVSIFAASFDTIIGRLISGCVVLAILLFAEHLVRITSNVKFRIWIVCIVISVMATIWGMHPSTHTPIFPNYNYWETGLDRMPDPDAYTLPGGYREGRYISVVTSLPILIHNKMSPAGYHLYKRPIDIMRKGDDKYVDVHIDHIATFWVASYYVSTDIIVYDNFHYHLRK